MHSCMKPVKDGFFVNLESTRWLWLECVSTDEPENESCFNVGSSSWELAKNPGILQVYPSIETVNQEPKVTYVWIGNLERRKVFVV